MSYFIGKLSKIEFFSKGNSYIGKIPSVIFSYLKILGNWCIWGQADPFKDVCSSCARERGVIAFEMRVYLGPIDEVEDVFRRFF